MTGDNLPVVLHAWKESPEIFPFAELHSAVRVMLERAGLSDVEWDLDGEALDAYDAQRQRMSKPVLAESFVERISGNKLRSDGWLADVLLACLKCRCPPENFSE